MALVAQGRKPLRYANIPDNIKSVRVGMSHPLIFLPSEMIVFFWHPTLRLKG